MFNFSWWEFAIGCFVVVMVWFYDELKAAPEMEE
jgi:hypothetical protein